MKKAVNIFIIILVLQANALAQCGINYKKILDKYCEGEYLIHQELDNKSDASASLILEKDNRYAVYLLNPSHSIPSFKLEGYGKLPFKDFETKYNQEENYSTYIFTVNETGEYYFSLDFGTEEKACVLMAIYLQNDNLFNTGIYKNFKEFKENKPSIELNYQISTKMRGYGILNASGQIPFYRLNIEKEKGKTIGKVFGFCDGENIYIISTKMRGYGILNASGQIPYFRLNIEREKGKIVGRVFGLYHGENVYIDENYPELGPKTEFVRTESLGKYLYFEDRGSTTTFIGTVPSTSYFLDQRILDINTGKVISLTKKTLQEIIANDSELLTEFKSDPKRGKSLKEYLIKYLERQNRIFK